MPPLKNLRQETFCQEWVKDHNDARAYQAAGYKCGTYNAQHVGAHNLLKTTKIKARILELDRPKLEKIKKASEVAAIERLIDRAWVVNTLVQNVDRSMQAEAVYDKDGNPTGVYRYEGGVANRGLELIGKNLGMFTDPVTPGDTYNTQMIFMMPQNDRNVNPEHGVHAPSSNGHSPTTIGNGHGEE